LCGVFIDTTSTFVWRAEESELPRRGHSRDRRPDQPQVIICLAVDRHGWPIAWDILPGNTDDRTAFTQMIETLRTRFHIGRVIVVADRGMLSQKVLDLLTGDPRAPFFASSRLRQTMYRWSPTWTSLTCSEAWPSTAWYRPAGARTSSVTTVSWRRRQPRM
jgi:hypothetical protein